MQRAKGEKGREATVEAMTTDDYFSSQHGFSVARGWLQYAVWCGAIGGVSGGETG